MARVLVGFGFPAEVHAALTAGTFLIISCGDGADEAIVLGDAVSVFVGVEDADDDDLEVGDSGVFARGEARGSVLEVGVFEEDAGGVVPEEGVGLVSGVEEDELSGDGLGIEGDGALSEDVVEGEDASFEDDVLEGGGGCVVVVGCGGGGGGGEGEKGEDEREERGGGWSGCASAGGSGHGPRVLELASSWVANRGLAEGFRRWSGCGRLARGRRESYDPVPISTI